MALETIEEGIHVVDTEGVTVIYNQAAVGETAQSGLRLDRDSAT
ncbi:hypothetical protein [Alicyclobacillus herbarius]|nr:hypothetical protein [Alicyclobacillus herbarius]